MMRKIKKLLLKINPLKYYIHGRNFYNDPHYIEVKKKNFQESSKKPSRTEIINYLLSLKQNTSFYLEIGVRNPAHNFNHIKATNKYSVDPGIEFKLNPVDFKMTSDYFFRKLSNGEILSPNIKFDIIFIDGLHKADQVDRDIMNSLKYLKDDGFIILHDCNPPTEWHVREHHRYWHTPAQDYWNGTTWKAFLKWRSSTLVHSCCIDTDWGVGIISKRYKIGKPNEMTNPFFEFNILDKNRKESLNLIDFDNFKTIISQHGI